jgi:hypothetical protein
MTIQYVNDRTQFDDYSHIKARNVLNRCKESVDIIYIRSLQ